MPDAEVVVGQLESIVELTQVRWNAVTHQFDVGNKLVGDVIVADVDSHFRSRVTAVDDAAETTDVGLVEEDRPLLTGVHHRATTIQRLGHELHRPRRHYTQCPMTARAAAYFIIYCSAASQQ